MNNYKYYELPICYMPSGLELKLPVHEISGGEGPVVGITASIHGDERIGIEIVRRLLDQFKTMDINGTIKMMSVANPLAFEGNSRNTPIDGKNINRIFPGTYNGSTTEIQAKVMAEKFIDGLDIYIDIHSGGKDPIVDYVMILNDEAFARAALSKILYKPKERTPGTSSAYAISKGIPNVVLEFGGGLNGNYYIDLNVNGILNMLRYKKVIPGDIQKRDDQIVVTHIENVNPHHGGLFVPSLTYDRMTTIVEGKVTLGKIYNPMTLELVEEMKAPYERNLIILMRGNINTVSPGDYAFMIGDLSTAE